MENNFNSFFDKFFSFSGLQVLPSSYLIFIGTAFFLGLIIYCQKRKSFLIQNQTKEVLNNLKDTGVIIFYKGFAPIWNHQAQKILGLEVAPPKNNILEVAKGLDLYHTPEEFSPIPITSNPFSAAKNDNIKYSKEVFYSKSQKAYIEIELNPIHKNKKEIGSFIFLKDVTEKNNLRLKRQKSLYNERMTTMGKVAAGLAHEINTPLCTSVLCHDSIKQAIEKKDPIKALHYLKLASLSIQRITDITKTLKKYAYLDFEKTDFQQIDLVEKTKDSIAICQLTMEAKGIALTFESSLVSAKAHTHPILYAQIIINLITNARDAIHNLNEKWIKIELSQCHQDILIRVTDSGHGIDKETQEKMFLPFFTTKEEGQGSGLGMGIIEENLNILKGEIKYELHNGRTSFVVKVPMNEVQAQKNKGEKICTQ